MAILTQFIFRLSFGLSLSMALTSPRQVTSGFYRNHLYVLLGLSVLALLAALAVPGEISIWPPLAAALFSYLGSAVWLYEKPRAGRLLLLAVAAAALTGAVLGMPSILETWRGSPLAAAMRLADPMTGGMVLGSTIAAMFLGHWYLNTPTMDLAPLRRLLALMAGSILLRAIVCSAGTALDISAGGSPQPVFVALRWLSGLLGAAALVGMAWQTLKIPNTQSATGILYVGVIAVFLGELTSQLLSAGLRFPV